MIRINLSSLAPTKAKRGGGAKRAAPALVPSVSIPGEGPSSVVLILVFLIVVLGGIGGTYWWANQRTIQLQADLQKAIAENQRLAEVKARYEAQKKKSDSFERRLKVIDELKEAQKGPAEMLNLVADTVNKTDAVWLDSMTNDGKSVDFVGMALSADAVADLMANLRKTGKFKSVEIKETSQDPQVKELQAFKFELICEIGFSGKVQKQG
jgi:Tfp pilus assembly protein PilN